MAISSDVLDSVRSEFSFGVDKFPLFGPDNMRTGVFGLFRNDTGAFVGGGSKTERYLPHKTDDVVALVESCSELFGDEARVNCHFRNGHYVSVAPSDSHRQKIYGERDNVFPRLVIRAGYDGQAFQATIGYFRDCCRNLAMLHTVEKTSVSFKRTNSLRMRMNDLIETFNNLKDGWKNLTDVIRHMESKEVSVAGFLDEIYGQPEADASKRAVTVHKNRTEAILKRLISEQFATGRDPVTENGKASAWQMFNAVQGFVQHDMGRRGSAVSQFDRILKAAKDPSVKAAERLAVAA